MSITTSELEPLLDIMRKGQRVERDDLPESLHILEECVRLHSAEYAVRIQHLENQVEALKQEKNKDSLETISDYILEFMQSQDIENFSTNQLRTNDGRQVELTVRYVEGKTPADLLIENRKRLFEVIGLLKEVDTFYQNSVKARGVPPDVCTGEPHIVNSIFVEVPLLKRISNWLSTMQIGGEVDYE